jgi:hypothetical protein
VKSATSGVALHSWKPPQVRDVFDLQMRCCGP